MTEEKNKGAKMKIYQTQAEVEKDIKNGVLAIEGDVEFRCSISIDASIHVTAYGLTAHGLNTCDIKAHNIKAHNITARNITARDIKAWDIKSDSLTARYIDAHDIEAFNITACSIIAGNISYYAFCNAYEDIRCSSITARRGDCSEPICLDGKLTIRDKPTETIKIGNNTYNKNDVETALRDVKSL